MVEKSLKPRPALRYESAKAMGKVIASLGESTDAPQQVSNSEQTTTPRPPVVKTATSNEPGEYVKPFYFREKEYRSLESLVEAFAESEASWSDALTVVGRGYVRKWLESNDDFGRAAEMEKHAEKSPEEQLKLLLHAHAPRSAVKVRSWMKTVITPEKDRSLENRVVTPEKKVVVPEKKVASPEKSFATPAVEPKREKSGLSGILVAALLAMVLIMFLLPGADKREVPPSTAVKTAGVSPAPAPEQTTTVFGKYLNEKDGSEMVLVPAGEFEMGEGEDTDEPKHRVHLDAYYIGKYAVTNAQYAKFVKETGHHPPENDFWNRPKEANHPVTGVSWDDAKAYAKWAGCTLPTEAQWEKAARGPKGYVYPWGNEWDETKCRNSVEEEAEDTAPVDAYPQGKSGYGTYQQAGNVWEWCSDWYGSDYYKSPEASRNPRGPASGSYRVLRGGCWWLDDPSRFRGALRIRCDPSDRRDYLGFRLVRTP